MPLTLNGTTGVAGINGSAATPTYQGLDTDTGVFYPAVNTIGFATNGIEQLRVTTTGLQYNGATSGSVTLKATAIAGTNTLTLPASTGTVSTTGFAVAMSVVFGG
jgi:hypothetical protein